jgi:hypothetical protein
MRLVLHYRGDLKANGGSAHKHDIRRALHLQLAERWKHPPLVSRLGLLQAPKPGGDYSLLRPLGAFTFVPLVSAVMNVVASLSLTLLRPEAPGSLLTQGGDMDNRLKTLFDALTMPRQTNALPPGAAPTTTETPFFCLLEDDNLVTELSVRTQQLLEPNVSASTVDLFIDIRTSVTRTTMGNTDFA